MKTIQEIFDLMIDEGFYSPPGNRFMCKSVSAALFNDLISDAEARRCWRAINWYMSFLRKRAKRTYTEGQPIVLRRHLAELMGGDTAEISCKTWGLVTTWIYSNWAKRPRTAEQVRRLVEKFQTGENK